MDWDANGFRLPTEAEWEYAARYIDGTNISSGAEHSGHNLNSIIGYCAWYLNNADDRTYPVGQLQPNSLGAYDMSGNVRESCWDWYITTYYDVSPTDNPQGPIDGFSRIRRGGCWYYAAEYCRTADRNGDGPDEVSAGVGFRVCRGCSVL